MLFLVKWVRRVLRLLAVNRQKLRRFPVSSLARVAPLVLETLGLIVIELSAQFNLGRLVECRPT